MSEGWAVALKEIWLITAQNPGMVGVLLFMGGFLPLLWWSGRRELKIQEQSDKREERLIEVIDTTLKNNTQALQVNTHSLEKLCENVSAVNTNVNCLTDRMVVVEKKLGVDPC
jgi:hypothetical protein